MERHLQMMLDQNGSLNLYVLVLERGVLLRDILRRSVALHVLPLPCDPIHVVAWSYVWAVLLVLTEKHEKKMVYVQHITQGNMHFRMTFPFPVAFRIPVLLYHTH